MHQVYNMGHRFEVYCLPELDRQVVEVARQFGIEAQVVGRTEKSGKAEGAIT